MQLSDITCFILLTISVVGTCVQAENQKQDLTEKKNTRKLTKREASVIIDNFPLESIFSKKPKVIYRRISKQRHRGPKSTYGSPKPKYGAPSAKFGPPKLKYGQTATKYRPAPPSNYGPSKIKYRPTKQKTGKPAKNPFKKYKSKNYGPKYGIINNKKRSPKPLYGPPKTSRTKPTYGPPKSLPYYSYNPQEPAGFGEPPSAYSQDFEPPKPTNGEPPVDSYGTPLKTAREEPYSTAQASPDTYDNQDSSFGPIYQSWHTDSPMQNIDNSYAYSKKHHNFVHPTANVFDNPLAIDYDENLESYSDIFKYGLNKEQNSFVFNNKKKPENFGDNLKYLNKPWKASDIKSNDDDQVIVGGQYAEPPARYVPKFQPSAPMYFGNEDFNPLNSVLDSDVVASATNSPYVNYKNSNMAFSPQNLNDAFSIVDK